ncbi:MAG: CRTAC1 family protein [Gammaproteobacteria bacterium]|nr:MAG: CRTAC1 family protein [Gammaproteobacteria bacterium]
MNNRQHTTGSHSGHHLIVKAFKRSLIVIFLMAIVIMVLWFSRQKEEKPAIVEESTTIVPVIQSDVKPETTPPEVKFVDITQQAGIEFIHINGAYGERLMPETMGGGGGFFDYDNDGDPDILLVNANYWPGHEEGPSPTLKLYRNDGQKKFTDVTEESNLDITLYGMSPAFGDYDNDGWTDIYITALGSNRLLHNNEGRFTDATQNNEVAGDEQDWSSSAAFIDYDNDGDLDLFVVNYVRWSRKIDLDIDFQLTGIGRAYGGPTHFTGTNNQLYRNDGNGVFTDVSSEAGILINDPSSNLPMGKGLAIMPVDYDRDGWLDIVIANDTTRNFLYHNLGNGTFEEIGEFEGLAYDRNGKATGAMGIDASWFRNDDDLGIIIGNFANEMSSLFATTNGKTPFADEAIIEGFGPASRLALTFGIFFFDYDLDGRLDLFQVNGHLEPEINTIQSSQQYAQPAQLFWNCGEACRTRLIEVEDTGDLYEPMVGRGTAYADIDSDGDLDILVIQNGRPAKLFENTQSTDHHWLRVRLQSTHSNRDAIGAIIELKIGEETLSRQVMPTRSYMSQVEKTVTFGLGNHTSVDSLKIIWPGGAEQHIKVNEIDTTLDVIQSDKG